MNENIVQIYRYSISIYDNSVLYNQCVICPQSELPGFYDPCVGDDKHLTIQYMFHNNLHCCTVSDSQALVLPRNSK